MKNKKFLWGVVNIGQQTEGFDITSNWSRWAKRDLVPEVGKANNYWCDFKLDHEVVEDIGCNSMRITIEWSRVEPEEGVFDEKAIKQYREILKDLKRRNISAVVGLWHWSVPMWFEEKYGMHHKKCPTLFLRFIKLVRDELGGLIGQIVIFNEPMVYILTSYLRGSRPPFCKKSYWRAWCVLQNLMKMHKHTYLLWKESFTDISIGSTYLWSYDTGRDNTVIQKIVLWLRDFLQDNYLVPRLQKHSDYIGVNYYTSNSFFLGRDVRNNNRFGFHSTNDWQSPTLWKQFPKGLYHVLLRVNKFDKPIFILENGKPTNPGVDDTNRQKFLERSVYYMQKAIAEGVDVRGYFYYSLCDSYEWDSGYNFKFGLVEIDRVTGERTKRKSCETYRNIIKNLTHKVK